jgi:hypothetical protein
VQYLGETFLFPVIDGRSLASTSTDYQYFYPCDGQSLPINGSEDPNACGAPVLPVNGPANAPLANLLGVDASGSDAMFTLPDMAPPADGMQWFISNTGPQAAEQAIDDGMPLVGQISIFPVPQGRQTYGPSELLPCDGRTLYAPDYPALFSLLGTTFGGDGQQTFVMPNLPAPGPALFYGMSTAGAVPQLVPLKAEVPA